MSRVQRKRYKTQDGLKMLLAESSDDDIDASDNESSNSDDDCLLPSQESDFEEDVTAQVKHPDCETDVESETEDQRGHSLFKGMTEHGQFRGRSMTRGRRGNVADELTTANVRHFVAKSGHIWSASPIRRQQCKRAPKNIVRFENGVKGAAKNVASLLDSFKLFIDDNILEVVVQETNKEGSRTYDEWNREHPDQLKTFRPTNLQDMLAYIGLLLLRGVYRSPGEPLRHLWTTDA